MSEGGNLKEAKPFEQEQGAGAGADRDLYDAEWLLDELDRVWFHDNALSFHIGDWLRSVQRSLFFCSDCSDFPYESIEKKKSIAITQHYEPCISKNHQQNQEQQQQQEPQQIVEMEEVSRSLRETGKVFSTGDLPRAPLAKISQKDLLKDDQQQPVVWEDDSSETNSAADCFSEGAASTEDVLPGEEEEVRRLETIPSSSALVPPPASIQQEVCPIPQPQPPRRRRRRQRRKYTRSLSELEFDELRGFRDLGFKLTKEDLTPRLVSLVPPLSKYASMPAPASGHPAAATRTGSGEIARPPAAKEGSRGTALSPYRERIYPSHAWSIRRPDSPLLNLRMPDPNREGVDMKAHLKFWARAVASTVRQEC